MRPMTALAMTVLIESEEPNPPQQSRPWAALPQDILRLIVEQLHLVDRIRFRAVCKDWLLAPIHDLQPIHKFPWIMNYWFTQVATLCSLCEPFCRESYDILEGKNVVADQRAKLSCATACASRRGWVLFSKRVGDTEALVGVTSFFLYNLISQEILTLPNLEEPRSVTSSFVADFSSDPTSPNCVFFVPHESIRRHNHIFISTYTIGDETWKTLRFTCPHGFSFYTLLVAYMEGSFYCFSTRGLLASFNIATQEWRPLVTVTWDILRPNTVRFLEYGGHLIVVLMALDSNFCRDECDILRFDWLDRAWVKMESLEGGAIFVGRSSFGVPAVGKTQMVANRVYYFSYNRLMFINYGPASSALDPTVDPVLLGGNGLWIEPPLLEPWRGQ